MFKYKNLFIGSICNNNCRYCDHESRSSRPLSEIQEELENTNGFVGVELAGGEPLVRFDLPDIVSHAVRAGHRRVKVITNGRVLADEAVVDRFLTAGVTGFEIKLYSYENSIHDAITGQPGSWSSTVKGIQNTVAADYKKYVAARIPITSDNYRILGHIVQFLVPLRVDRIIMPLADGELRLAEAAPFLRGAIETALVNRLWIVTERMPLCAMYGYEHHVAEAYGEPSWSGQKLDGCSACIYHEVCDGVHEHHNIEEILHGVTPPAESGYISDLRKLRRE